MALITSGCGLVTHAATHGLSAVTDGPHNATCVWPPGYATAIANLWPIGPERPNTAPTPRFKVSPHDLAAAIPDGISLKGSPSCDLAAAIPSGRFHQVISLMMDNPTAAVS